MFLGELVFQAPLKTPAWEAILNADNKKFHLFWILLMSLSTWLVRWLTTMKLSISTGSRASRERTGEERQSHEYCVSFRLLLACLPAISSKGVYALTELWVLSTFARLGTVSEMAGRYGQQFFLREDCNVYSFVTVGTKTVHPPQLTEDPDYGGLPFGRLALIQLSKLYDSCP